MVRPVRRSDVLDFVTGFTAVMIALLFLAGCAFAMVYTMSLAWHAAE